MTLPSLYDAPQHRPRPLPLFLALLRSETEGDPARMQAALAGLRRYQTADRAQRTASPPALFREGRAALLDYGGSGPDVLVVPSLINPPHVLDLTERVSLMRWLATQGLRPLLLDWGEPDIADRDLSVAGHVERYLLPLMRKLPRPPLLAGYCLGGTMTLAAAAHIDVPGLLLLAAPWHFAGFGDEGRTMLRNLWDQSEAVTNQLGMLPIEVLQTAFWTIDPQRTVAKFERYAAMDPASDEAAGFVALEDWASDGPPLTAAAGRELLVEMAGEDVTGRGLWEVGGRRIDPARLTCPILNVVSSTDRIVPEASAPDVGERLTLALGHVGMIVGRQAPAVLWEPVSRWLSNAAQN